MDKLQWKLTEAEARDVYDMMQTARASAQPGEQLVRWRKLIAYLGWRMVRAGWFS